MFLAVFQGCLAMASAIAKQMILRMCAEQKITLKMRAAIFDKTLQDKMGRELLRRKGFDEYKAGKITTKTFIKKLSEEWASLPKDESNESYYKGVGNNKALTDFKTVKELLEKK